MYTQLYNHFHDTAQYANAFRETLVGIIVIVLPRSKNKFCKTNSVEDSIAVSKKGFVAVKRILPIHQNQNKDTSTSNDDGGELPRRSAAW